MPMKLILREDVENLGRLGQVVSVKPGYGRNYLIPRGMAMPATEANQKVFELERRKLEERANKARGEAQSKAQQLEGLEVIIPVRVGENEKLYGSVTSAMIADVLEQQGVELDRRKIILEQPIRALGAYSVPVKLHADVTPELTVKVVDQDRGHHQEEQPKTAEPEAENQG